MTKKRLHKLKGGNETMETTQESNSKLDEVIHSVRNYNPKLVSSCYAVGAWIWAEFNERLSQEEVTFLKQVGFRWNRTRKLWQNACGVKRRKSAGDPRQKYSVITLTEN